MESFPQPIALMSIAACQASGRFCVCVCVCFHLIPQQASQRLSMARYTTGTATENESDTLPGYLKVLGSWTFNIQG